MNPILFEKIIIKLIFVNDKIRTKVLPFLQESLFDNEEHNVIIKKILYFYEKHSKFPSIADLKLKLDETIGDVFKEIVDLDISEYTIEELLEGIEHFFKEKMVNNVNVNIMDKLTEGKVDECVPYVDELREALSFSFDTSIGHDILEDAEKFYEFLHSIEKIVPTGIESLDYFLQGGLYEKTLTLLMANSNMGKSLVMGSLATNMLLNNKKVLIVTLEMSEFKYARRILGNLFDVDINSFKGFSKEEIFKMYEEKRKLIKSKLIVKEYPTKSINANNIRNLLTNLRMKKGFEPDAVFVDYLEIMRAINSSKNSNSFEEMKKISEDLRGLSCEVGPPFFSATQTNRGALGSPELSVDDMSQSIGPLFTADVLLGLTQPEEYQKIGKFLLHILKNRDGEKNKKITLDVNYNKMRITDDVESNKRLREKPVKKEDSAISMVGSVLKSERESKDIDNFKWE